MPKSNSRLSRRRLLQAGLATSALAGLGDLPLAAAERGRAAEWVTLGRSDVRVSRLAFGTGSFGGEVQRNLGQANFTRLVRYAYDHGIRFFETADSYAGMHEMLGIALAGLPRDSYRLLSKVTTSGDPNHQAQLDRLRREARTEYFDIMLLHWQHTADWPEETTRWQNSLSEAKLQGVVRSHGASVHGLPALRQVPGNQWLDLAMIRVNHKGTRMDAENYATDGPGNVSEVVHHIHQVRAQGMGVLSMKLIGEGQFTNRADRQAAMRFAFRNAGVDSVTVGYKSPAEVDEAIENVNLAFA